MEISRSTLLTGSSGGGSEGDAPAEHVLVGVLWRGFTPQAEPGEAAAGRTGAAAYRQHHANGDCEYHRYATA